MAIEKDALKVLVTQMKLIVQKAVEKAAFTKEYTGVVEEVLSSNKFKIRYNDTSYEMTTKNNVAFKVYDKVHVIHPNNIIKNRYILEDVIKGVLLNL